MASFDVRANLQNSTEKTQTTSDDRAGIDVTEPLGMRQAIVYVHTAHAQQLIRSGVVDEAGFQAIARALDSVLQAKSADDIPGVVIRNVEERVDALLPREFAGAATLGATRVETIATSLRMSWRESALRLYDSLITFRESLLTLADAHAVTIMAAVWDRRPANPTTLAHFLGGVIGPLNVVSQRLQQAITFVDQSPLGAGVLAGDVLEADREQLARDLGFSGPLENTLDALSSVEDLVALAEAMSAAMATSRRLMSELLTWIRTEPTSFFLDEQWESFPEPSMPAHTTSARLELLVLGLREAESKARGFVDLARSLPYGPLGASWDAIALSMDEVLGAMQAGVTNSTAAINEALIVNRAYLANRAGRLYTTASDLVPFLMTEESLPPTAARQIASLVVSRLREASLEASAVTQDMIDSAAVMVIGRELKVEMETLGRYLAPRRFIERRAVMGSPAPEMTRTWLAHERASIVNDKSWASEQRSVWTNAIEVLKSLLASSAESDEG